MPRSWQKGTPRPQTKEQQHSKLDVFAWRLLVDLICPLPGASFHVLPGGGSHKTKRSKEERVTTNGFRVEGLTGLDTNPKPTTSKPQSLKRTVEMLGLRGSPVLHWVAGLSTLPIFGATAMREGKAGKGP